MDRLHVYYTVLFDRHEHDREHNRADRTPLDRSVALLFDGAVSRAVLEQIAADIRLAWELP
jgi:hypothetical protein